jgi:hypothetical protein
MRRKARGFSRGECQGALYRLLNAACAFIFYASYQPKPTCRKILVHSIPMLLKRQRQRICKLAEDEWLRAKRKMAWLKHAWKPADAISSLVVRKLDLKIQKSIRSY